MKNTDSCILRYFLLKLTGLKINLRVKIKKFFGLLIVLPILAGLFCGAAEADAADDCEDKNSCETSLATAQTEYKDIVDLHEAFLDCWEWCGDCSCEGGEDQCEKLWEYCYTDKRGKEDEEWCSGDDDTIYEEAEEQVFIYTTEKNRDMPTTLEGIAEELEEERKELSNEITALKMYLHSFEDVSAKYILGIEGQKTFSDAKYFLGRAIDLLIKMVGMAALVFLVIGGFRLVVAAGNDNEIQKAKSMIQYAVVGLVVALLAYLIVAAAQGILYR